jgi:hypothetical protein
VILSPGKSEEIEDGEARRVMVVLGAHDAAAREKATTMRMAAAWMDRRSRIKAAGGVEVVDGGKRKMRMQRVMPIRKSHRGIGEEQDGVQRMTRAATRVSRIKRVQAELNGVEVEGQAGVREGDLMVITRATRRKRRK